ncbi:hypothetical protein K458DRAFT_58164 [Lentithecium fluviatile CBS 122367]|uniref:Uncharacterized protein n=1 Tax=Lentithecium fluviatile CBS 122367 TaxID=1168545 RepID=A0A6G1IVX4_9PLEO|nr:hypothetical protein K458DRAFT_58164 [Lentithecium fluviatile CBS 122367]
MSERSQQRRGKYAMTTVRLGTRRQETESKTIIVRGVRMSLFTPRLQVRFPLAFLSFRTGKRSARLAPNRRREKYHSAMSSQVLSPTHHSNHRRKEVLGSRWRRSPRIPRRPPFHHHLLTRTPSSPPATHPHPPPILFAGKRPLHHSRPQPKPDPHTPPSCLCDFGCKWLGARDPHRD